MLLAVVAACVVSALTLAAFRALLPWSIVTAVVPGLALSLVVATRPPAPARLRTIGWTLVSISVLTAAILVVTFAGTS